MDDKKSFVIVGQAFADAESSASNVLVHSKAFNSPDDARAEWVNLMQTRRSEYRGSQYAYIQWYWHELTVN